MNGRTGKLKSYINEISLLVEKDSFDLKAFKLCFDSFEFSAEELKDLKRIASVHTKRSEEQLESKRLQEALMSMERAVEINPLSGEYRNRLAQLYLMKSQGEGPEGKSRKMAEEQANFSLLLESKDLIARNILKEIKMQEKKKQGIFSIKKAILPTLFLIILIGAAFFTNNNFTFPFLNRSEENNISDSFVPEVKKVKMFTERDMETQVSGAERDSKLEIDLSRIEKTNGSFSYTLQGRFSNDKAAVTSADLNISFKDHQGNSLLTKTYPVVTSNQWLIPGETRIIDHFFYLNYLPPDIDKVNLSLSNLNLSDEIPENQDEAPLSITWDDARPEGVKISIWNKESRLYDGYSSDYFNIKLKVINEGTMNINELQIELKWRTLMGDHLYTHKETLMAKGSPSLPSEESRIFYVLTSLPHSVVKQEKEMYIDVTRID